MNKGAFMKKIVLVGGIDDIDNERFISDSAEMLFRYLFS